MGNEFYEIPGGLAWCKANLKIIIGNEDLAEIMQFGDLWRSRGHKPLVHVTSPAMDAGKMWERHKDPSGLFEQYPRSHRYADRGLLQSARRLSCLRRGQI